MEIGSSILSELWADKTPYFAAALVLMSLAVRALAPEQNQRMRGPVVLFGLHLLLVPIAGALRAFDSSYHRETQLAALIVATLAVIATSAVLTAVIGLAFQDTLGNVVGGLALQLDNSIRIGDWIKVGDVNGRVTEIRWRYTAIETRNWETVIVPNSQLVKGQVLVLGRRTGKPVLAVRENLDLAARDEQIRVTFTDLLGKIRNFFALDDGGGKTKN